MKFLFDLVISLLFGNIKQTSQEINQGLDEMADDIGDTIDSLNPLKWFK